MPVRATTNQEKWGLMNKTGSGYQHEAITESAATGTLHAFN
jgi:hypothetical protein